MNDDLVERLLDDLEESLWAMDYVALYEFMWALRGMRTGLDEAALQPVCQAAFSKLTRKHALKLVWTRWPIDTENAWPAEDGTPLDFDLDSESDPNEPLLVLVPT